MYPSIKKMVAEWLIIINNYFANCIYFCMTSFYEITFFFTYLFGGLIWQFKLWFFDLKIFLEISTQEDFIKFMQEQARQIREAEAAEINDSLGTFIFIDIFILIWMQSLVILIFSIWARAAGPRYRPDQVHEITWKDILIVTSLQLLCLIFCIPFR